MSRQRLKSRDKITQKMSRNGVVESNVTSGEDIRISSRETEFDIRGSKPENETLSQLVLCKRFVLFYRKTKTA